jgi:hypothetical protein
MKNLDIDLSRNSFLSQLTNESSFIIEIVNKKFKTLVDELDLNTQIDNSFTYKISIKVRTNFLFKVSSYWRFKKKTLRANKKLN